MPPLTDSRLRRAGFAIESRIKNEQPRWRKGKRVYVEEVAVKLCEQIEAMRAEKKVS